jgi:tRNA G18 (ribose-2'-O)-methylase SpoU
MRGYFGIGVEGLNKAMNAGSLFRTAHAFGAGFLFTVSASYDRGKGGNADTSDAVASLPLYSFDSVADMSLPQDCALVGVEIIDRATALPSFRHPRCAAYVLGGERGALSKEILRLCDDVVQFPTKFSVNLAIAGAIVMYDRLISSGRFARRPVVPGGPAEPLPAHEFGQPISRKKKRAAKAGGK